MKTSRFLMLSSMAAGVMFTAFGLSTSSVRACIHLPEEYEGSFQAQSQQTIVVSDGKNETLIVKVESPTGSAPADGKPIPLVSIIPVPASHTAIKLDTLHLAGNNGKDSDQAEAATALFKELKELVDENCKPRSRGLGGEDALPFGLPMGQEVVVGPYGISKFDNSAAGLKGLQAWVANRSVETAGGSMQTAPIKALDTDLPAFKYYTKGTWAFCAVRVVDMSKALTPLQITFPSTKVYWPIKLMAAGSKASQSRNGSYTAYVMTPKGKDFTPLMEDMARHGMKQADGLYSYGGTQKPLELDEEIMKSKPALKKFALQFGLGAGESQLMRFQGSFLGREAARLEDDVLTSLK